MANEEQDTQRDIEAQLSDAERVARFKAGLPASIKEEDKEMLAEYAAEGLAEYKETQDPSYLVGLKSFGATQEAVDAAISMGEQLVRQGLLEQAAKWFAGLLPLEPMNPKAYLWTGIVAQKMKDYGSAITAYRLARSLDPELAAAYLYLGECLLLQGEHDVAFAELRIGLDLSKGQKGLVALRQRAEKFLSIQEKLKQVATKAP
jgi:tetratricopeptide (TPR) repeat protein